MRRAIVVAIGLGACGGAAPRASWVETERHANHGSMAEPLGTAAALPADLTTLDALAIDLLDEATTRAALALTGDAAPTAKLALRAARLAHHRGDDEQARADLARAATAVDEADAHDPLVALAPVVARIPLAPAVIAVLLPMSGRYAAIGRELAAAVQSAPATGTKWIVIDTKGELAGAEAAVASAAAKGALAILGPVGEREAIAAGRAAAIRGIPIALLAPADGADATAGVFRMVDSPADEGRAIAQLAADEGFPTVGVLAPRDDVATDAADAFAAEAARLGLHVTAQGSYDPTHGDLEADLKAFLNLNPATNPRFRQHLRHTGKKGWQTFTPDIAYSLLYIPDRYDRAALVAAYLPYYNVELRTTDFPDLGMLQRKHGGVMPQVVQLVGGAGWHHPTLGVRGGDALQGALVVDTFAIDAGGAAAVSFAEAFQQRTGREPSTAAAQAYDAALVMTAARARATGPDAADPDARRAMRSALATAVLDDGACGPAQMGGDGELHREPVVLEVMGDDLVLRP